MAEPRKKRLYLKENIKRDLEREGEYEINSESGRIDFSQFAIKRNLSVPNFISFLRILLIPWIMLAYFQDRIQLALILIVISGISDSADGFIARRFGQITTLGKVLDPIADKLTQIALAVCLCFAYPELILLAVTLLVKDVLFLLGGLRFLRNGMQPLPARIWGKVATVLFYLGIGSIILFSDTMSVAVLWGIVWLLILSMLFSMFRYWQEYRRHLPASAEV